ncbi:MAG: ThuA domain-containing protein [Acidimicrobiia bacterium]
MISNLLLSGGPVHDFDATSGAIAALLADGDPGPIETTIVDDPTDAFARLRAGRAVGAPEWDLLTVNALHWRMEADRYADARERDAFDLGGADGELISAFVHAGGGLLALHTAVISFDAEPHWRALIGAAWKWEHSSHPPSAKVAVQVTAAGRRHPITAEIEAFCIVDEVYCSLDRDDDIEPLLTATLDGTVHPLLWARAAGAGRVVTDLLGHGVESIAHPAHRTILRRAAAWTLEGAA